ncbi:MAG: dihydroxyacetone kinase subunit DhaL [Eubacteriales bacterium]|nr:dihydroxyacetone kinase subunit DhaL [Eubacteriales bacterium]
MTFKNMDAWRVVLSMIETIQYNAAYLSEIDGKIGDGDHGINMNKGFTLCKTRLEGKKYTLSQGLEVLSRTLMEDIGGSMGPLYGVFFDEMSMVCGGLDKIDVRAFENMLKAALAGIQDIGNAKRGDKTLLDTLIPGLEAYSAALADGRDFPAALDALKTGAKAGWEFTKDMVAKVGRASRLGERSRGVLDAGATSCYLILCAMADTVKTILQ